MPLYHITAFSPIKQLLMLSFASRFGRSLFRSSRNTYSCNIFPLSLGPGFDSNHGRGLSSTYENPQVLLVILLFLLSYISVVIIDHVRYRAYEHLIKTISGSTVTLCMNSGYLTHSVCPYILSLQNKFIKSIFSNRIFTLYSLMIMILYSQ